MLNKKEVAAVIISMLFMTLLLIASDLIKESISLSKFLTALIISIIIILVSVYSKKLTSRIINAKTEIKLWEFKRWWISTRSEFKKPIPIGIILPLLLSFLSLGFIKMLTFLQIKVTALPGRVAKRYGSRRFSNIMEWDDALIVFYSSLTLLILSILSSFLNSPFSSFFNFFFLSKYSLYYAMYNLIPFSSLDGMKLFMGSKPLYVFTWVLIGLTALIVFI